MVERLRLRHLVRRSTKQERAGRRKISFSKSSEARRGRTAIQNDPSDVSSFRPTFCSSSRYGSLTDLPVSRNGDYFVRLSVTQADEMMSWSLEYWADQLSSLRIFWASATRVGGSPGRRGASTNGTSRPVTRRTVA